MAAEGILKVGKLFNLEVEGQMLYKKMLSVKRKSTNEICNMAILMYTYESFLFRTLNKALREEDLNYTDLLGPFLWILW